MISAFNAFILSVFVETDEQIPSLFLDMRVGIQGHGYRHRSDDREHLKGDDVILPIVRH